MSSGTKMVLNNVFKHDMHVYQRVCTEQQGAEDGALGLLGSWCTAVQSKLVGTQSVDRELFTVDKNSWKVVQTVHV